MPKVATSSHRARPNATWLEKLWKWPTFLFLTRAIYYSTLCSDSKTSRDTTPRRVFATLGPCDARCVNGDVTSSRIAGQFARSNDINLLFCLNQSFRMPSTTGGQKPYIDIIDDVRHHARMLPWKSSYLLADISMADPTDRSSFHGSQRNAHDSPCRGPDVSREDVAIQTSCNNPLE